MVVATFAGTLCQIGQSWVLGQLTTHAVAQDAHLVVASLWALAILWVAGPLFSFLQTTARLYSSQNIRIAVTDQLTSRLMYGSPVDIARESIGNVVERVEAAAAAATSVTDTVGETVVKLLSVAVLIGIVLTGVSAPLAAAAVAWMVSAVALSSYLAYTGMKIVEDAADAHATVMSRLVEIVANVAVIRSFLAQKPERARFGGDLAVDLVACRRVRSYWLFVLLFESAYKWAFGAMVIAYAAASYLGGTMTLAQLVTVCSLIISLSWHFESVAFHFVDLFDAAGTLRSSLDELKKIDVNIDGERPPVAALPEPGRLRLKYVCVVYDGVTVLDEVSLDIAPGTKVAIVGLSGAGKSTLIGLLRGDVVPSSGSVELHGLGASAMSARDKAAHASESLREAPVFARTIEENLLMGASNIEAATVWQALDAVQLSPLISSLPQGLQTRLSEGGQPLSTGERQRLSIARALLKPAPLLLLDEASSSVDVVAERAIVECLTANVSSTVVFVTHRAATVSYFDMVVLLSEGRVADMGSPTTLLQRSALFRRLCEEPEGDRCDLAA